MKTTMNAARIALTAIALALPLSLTTGCSTGRMALSHGLHSRCEPDQAILASTDVPPADIVAQRHARLEPQSNAHSARFTGADLEYANIAPTAEDENFVAADGNPTSH